MKQAGAPFLIRWHLAPGSQQSGMEHLNGVSVPWFGDTATEGPSNADKQLIEMPGVAGLSSTMAELLGER